MKAHAPLSWVHDPPFLAAFLVSIYRFLGQTMSFLKGEGGKEGRDGNHVKVGEVNIFWRLMGGQWQTWSETIANGIAYSLPRTHHLYRRCDDFVLTCPSVMGKNYIIAVVHTTGQCLNDISQRWQKSFSSSFDYRHLRNHSTRKDICMRTPLFSYLLLFSLEFSLMDRNYWHFVWINFIHMFLISLISNWFKPAEWASWQKKK